MPVTIELVSLTIPRGLNEIQKFDQIWKQRVAETRAVFNLIAIDYTLMNP